MRIYLFQYGYYFLLLAACYLSFPLASVAQHLPIQEIEYVHADFTLPSTKVTQVFQDRDGYLWLMAEGVGLTRYDGQEMEVNGFGHSSDFAVYKMLQDGKGYLWILGLFNSYISNESLSSSLAVESLSFSSVNVGGEIVDWKVDKDGAIWTRMADFLVRHTRKENYDLVSDTFMLKKNLSIRKDYFFLCTPNGEIWTRFSPEGTYMKLRFSDNGNYQIVDSTTSKILLEDATGGLWIHEGGYIMYSKDNKKTRYLKSEYGTNEIQIIKDNTVLILTDSLMTEISPQIYEQRIYTKQEGLPDQLNDLFVNAHGYIWMSHSEGLSFLPPNHQAFESIAIDGEILKENAADIISINKQNGLLKYPFEEFTPHLMIATQQALYIFTIGAGTIKIAIKEELERIELESTGDVIVHAKSGGIQYHIRLPQILEVFFHNHSSYYDSIAKAQVIRDFSDRVELEYDYNSSQHKYLQKFIQNAFIPSSAPKNKNTLEEQKAYKRAYLSSYEKFTAALAWNNEKYMIYEALLWHEDQLWVAVRNGLLILENPSDWQAVGFLPLDKNIFPQSLLYAHHKIWVNSETSFWGINPSDHEIVCHFPKKNPYLPSRADADTWLPKPMVLGTDSLIYFATNKGVEKFDPRIYQPETWQIPINFKTVTYQENNWGTNELNIKYVGLSYRDPFSVSYRTRLKGYDQDWSAETKEQTIRYTSLGAFFFPKTYQFEVMAKDYRDIWYEMETPFVFQVKPALPLRWWAFLIYAALLFLGIRLYVNNRLKQQLRTQKLQEAEVIKTQRDEIAQKNAQNELLLKEIHHRVKNNLETVSSLLELQSAQVKNADVQSIMQASQSRVQSMSILHQKLYQGKNLAVIEMKDYFKNLSESILDTYDAWEQVVIEYDIQSIELDIDTAIPLGLIANELVTNSLKYAFPNNQKGTIKLSLQEIGEKIKFSVKDNGIGLQEKSASPKSGFGSQLINLLVSQIGGKMTVQNQDGLLTTIEFNRG